MSYIQIQLNGKLKGLKFNQLAWEEYVKLIPQDENNKFNWLQSNSMNAYAVVYAGLVGNAVVKREVVDFTFEQVSEWVDEAKTEDIKEAWKLFEGSQQYKVMLEKFSEQIRSMAPKDDKKKSYDKDSKEALEFDIFQLHAFAFGVLGWTPYEYYTSSPYEFFAACEGYFIKIEHQAQMMRMGFYRVHQSLVEKPLSIENFWPLFGEKQTKQGAIVMSKEQWDQIKQIHA